MSFSYLDYSPIYFSCVARTELPPVRAGKFVQLENGQAEHVVLSPRQLSTYHANIVERFFHRKDIPGSYNSARDDYAIGDSRWRVLGGGYWEMNDHQRSLRLWGQSKAYGPFVREGLLDHLSLVAELADYRITIG